MTTDTTNTADTTNAAKQAYARHMSSLDDLDLEGFTRRLISGRSMSYVDDHNVWHYTDDPVALALPIAERAYIEQSAAHANQTIPTPPSLRHAAALGPFRDWFDAHNACLYDMPDRAEKNMRRRRNYAAACIVDRWVERIAGPVPPGGYPDATPYQQLALQSHFPNDWRLTNQDDLDLAAHIYAEPLDEAEIGLLSEEIVSVVIDYIIN